jgi:hypothetical protein
MPPVNQAKVIEKIERGQSIQTLKKPCVLSYGESGIKAPGGNHPFSHHHGAGNTHGDRPARDGLGFQKRLSSKPRWDHHAQNAGGLPITNQNFAEHHADPRMALEKIELRRESPRQHDIIRIMRNKILAPGKREQAVLRPGHAPIFPRAEKSYPGITAVWPCHLIASVGRAVIVNQELKGAMILPQDAFNGFSEVAGGIVDRHQHADQTGLEATRKFCCHGRLRSEC